MTMYNPYLSPSAQQMQVERLMQQRQMLDSQIQMLSQPAPQPAVNVNVSPQSGNQTSTPAFMQTPSSYDAGVMYIDSYDDAKKAAATDIPVMYMEKDRPYLHLKGADGNLTTFELKQIQIEDAKPESALQQQVNDLQGKMDMLLAALTQQQAQPVPVQSQPVDDKPKAQAGRKQTGKEANA